MKWPKLVKSDVTQSTPKLNIANMFFYLKSKQKGKPRNLAITMFLGFCSQMPQKDMWWKEAKHLVSAVFLKTLSLLSQYKYKYLDPHPMDFFTYVSRTVLKILVFTLASYYSCLIEPPLPVKSLSIG